MENRKTTGILKKNNSQKPSKCYISEKCNTSIVCIVRAKVGEEELH